MDATRQPLAHGISAVVPVYDSAETVERMVDAVTAALGAAGEPYELILVNDGSPDRSWETIARLARNRPQLRGINLMRNYGQHNAILCGVRAARYDKVLTLDDDLQYDPAELPRLLAKLDEGYDVVYGKERQRHHTLGHNFGSWLLRLGLSVALGTEIAKIVSPFRVFRTKLRETFRDNRNPRVSLDVFLCWGTTRFGVVDVGHHERSDGGKTRYTSAKRISHAFDLITGFSTVPLKIASLIGFFFTLFGIVLLAYVLSVYFLYGGIVPGWVFLASTISIFSGAQLFALGIIGEYLARMYTRIMGRPPYAVAEEIGSAETVVATAGRDAAPSPSARTVPPTR